MKPDGQAEYQRHQVYVPVGAIARVQEMIAERESVAVAGHRPVDFSGIRHWNLHKKALPERSAFSSNQWTSKI